MFKGRTPKATVYFRDSNEGFSSSSTSVPLKEKNLIEYLRSEYKRHGPLVIEYMSESGEMHITTNRSVKYEKEKDRIGEIAELVRNYVRNRTIPMEAHAVFVEGELKGVFGRESYAELKKTNLISKGVSPESVTVKPVQVNSFEDFS